MSSPAPFTLCRLYRNERTYFYALFRNPETGKRTNKKSVERLRTRLGIFSEKPIQRRDEAIRICQQALERGLIFGEKEERILVREYLRTFYDWEKSPYVARRNTLSPNSIGKDYITTRRSLIDNHVIPLVKPNLLLSAVTLGWIEDLQYNLVKMDALAPSTVNVIMSAVLAAFKEAQRRGFIQQNIILEIKHLDVVHRARGVLTEKEMTAFLLYAKEQSEKRIYLACLLALITGMRSGELRALRQEAIGKDLIIVDQAYADHAGLKSPKGKRSRYVPCPSWLCEQLRQLADENPFEGDHELVFWSKRGGGFVSSHYFSDRFKKELAASEVLTMDEIQERNITFHSLRHMANSLLRGSIDEHLLRMTIGHSSQALTDLYTHLNESGLKSVALAQERMILSLLDHGHEKGLLDTNKHKIH